MINTKLKAFIAHLFISSAILAVLLAIILLFWYPGELIHAGATEGLRILVGVDIVLGPLLTLIVFKEGKKSLSKDLAVIGAIQGICLLGGLWLVYNERPVAQVLADDGIHLMTRTDFELYKETLPSDDSGIHPNAYLLELPDDWSQIPSIKLSSEIADKKPISFRTDLYKPFSGIEPQDFSSRVTNIIQHLQEGKKTELGFLEKSEHCNWIPVISKHTNGAACVNLKTGVVKLSEHKQVLPF